jgi:DNA-binding winged helix-turn-helix (wHTH) protein
LADITSKKPDLEIVDSQRAVTEDDREGGQQVRLERRPMDLLILLVQRRRELVSRNDIVERLWGQSVFVDVDMGVNTAIRKIRQVLGDAPETPAFVETVSGKGYRFIAEVEAVQPAPAPSASRAVTLAVLPFENLGGTPEHDYIADGFTEEATTALGQRILSTLDAIAHDRYVPPYAFALIYAGLEDRERALAWLERAYTVRDVHPIWLPMDARWDAFRTEPAFVELIERCGFILSPPTA